MFTNFVSAFIGVGVIVLIYWFFFSKKDEVARAREGKLNVVVDGGYHPSVIIIKKGEKTVISFLRKDESDCLEDFILPEYKINKYLPLNKKVDIEITPTKKGEFPFHCGMNMFHGRVVVE